MRGARAASVTSASGVTDRRVEVIGTAKSSCTAFVVGTSRSATRISFS